MKLINALPIRVGMYARQFDVKLKLEGSVAKVRPENNEIYLPYPKEGLEDLTLGFACQCSASLRHGDWRATEIFSSTHKNAEVFKGIHSVIEEFRTNQAFMSHYHGVKHYYDEMAKSMVECYPQDTAEFTLATYIEVYIRGKIAGYLAYRELQGLVQQWGNDNIPNQLKDQLDILLNSVTNLQSHEDGLKLTSKILTLLTDYVPEPEDGDGQDGDSQDGDSQDGDNQDGKNQKDKKSGNKNKSDNSQDGDSQDGDDSDSKSDSDQDGDDSDSKSDSDQDGDDSDSKSDSDQNGDDSDSKSDSDQNGDNSDSKSDSDQDGDDSDNKSDSDQNGDDSDSKSDSDQDGDDSDSKSDSDQDGDDSDNKSDSDQNGDDSDSKSDNSQNKTESEKQKMLDDFLNNTSDFLDGNDAIAKILSNENNQDEEMQYGRSDNAANVKGLLEAAPELDGCGYGDTLMQATLMETSLLRNKLNALISTENRTQKQTLKKGRKVNGRKLSRLQVGRVDIFTRKTKKEFKPNSAVTVLLDCSGSIGNGMRNIQKAAYTLIDVLTSVQGVDTSAFAFGGIYTDVRLKHFNEQAIASVGRIERLSSDGSTPLEKTLLKAIQDLYSMRNKKRVLLVLTDGSPNNSRMCKKLILEMQQEGVLCIGVGMGRSIAENSLKEMYGAENYIIVKEFADLANEMIALSQRLIFTTL